MQRRILSTCTLGLAALAADLEVTAAAPYRPSDDAQVLERLPSASSKT